MSGEKTVNQTAFCFLTGKTSKNKPIKTFELEDVCSFVTLHLKQTEWPSWLMLYLLHMHLAGAGGGTESPGRPIWEQLLYCCPPVYRRREELLRAVTGQHRGYVVSSSFNQSHCVRFWVCGICTLVGQNLVWDFHCVVIWMTLDPEYDFFIIIWIRLMFPVIQIGLNLQDIYVSVVRDQI